MNNEYSLLYNERANRTVCVYGQIVLYELCKRLSDVADIININTDGVVIIPHDEQYREIAKEWEQDFNFKLDEESFDLFVQRDVNNYIAVQDGGSDSKGAVT